MQEYEMMILYVPLLLDDIKKNTISKIYKIVEKNKGNIVEVNNLGKKLLAYPIKNYEEGHYIEYNVKSDSLTIKELESKMRLMKDVLRYIIIKK